MKTVNKNRYKTYWIGVVMVSVAVAPIIMQFKDMRPFLVRVPTYTKALIRLMTGAYTAAIRALVNRFCGI